MKRIMMVFLAVLLFSSCARAQTYTIRDAQNRRDYFVCEDFAGSMPESAQTAFGGLVREGDEILCGTVLLEYLDGESALYGGEAMMAIRRGESLLLLGAAMEEGSGRWKAAIESDSFLPENSAFSMTAATDYTLSGVLRNVSPSIVCGDETLVLRVTVEGGLYLWQAVQRMQDGTERVMECGSGSFCIKKRENGKTTPLYDGAGPMPSRLLAWTYASLPRTPEAIEAWLEAHPYQLEKDEGFITGVNLREKPTGKSPSWGAYRAKVKILGQQPGRDAPWYHVRVGDLEGWVSGVYLSKADDENLQRLYAYQTAPYAVGRARREAQLLRRPDGERVMALPEGTLVHVLMEKDGWLHVIVPRGALSWQTEWDGTYGFVKAEDMDVGISRADAVWK